MTGFQAGHFSRDFNSNRSFDIYMLQNMKKRGYKSPERSQRIKKQDKRKPTILLFIYYKERGPTEVEPPLLVYYMQLRFPKEFTGR